MSPRFPAMNSDSTSPDAPQTVERKGSDDMTARAKRASLAKFDRIMAEVPTVEPPDYDRLPEGYQPAR